MTPAESFNFMGVQLHDPEALRKYTRGCIGVSKLGQKIFVGVAFPLVFVLALLFPVNAAVYFNIRHLLHKDWTPSLVGFISGLIAILFFIYWLVPAACRYVYATLYKGEKKKIEFMANIEDIDLQEMRKYEPYVKGVDPSAVAAVQDTRLDEVSIRAAQGIPLKTLNAIREHALDPKSIKAAKEIEESGMTLEDVFDVAPKLYGKIKGKDIDPEAVRLAG